ncbi:MAG: 5-formyltetrahydrofolate cyclo-ligase [Candidatus Omnitrophica bacterium]|nr:5-formyltetrahydrofolate cyclo-ligase [Candidatus Omnitrophota bacterium]MBU1854018.1 5-formyltetrahydrofolate cyclo-ligase [Candidatus Omnitrophota bacterium]
MNKKELLRIVMKRKLDFQNKLERRKKSKIIQGKVFAQEEFLASKCIMLYVSKGTGEVETGPIIKKALGMGKTVVLPVTLVKEKKIKPVCLKNFKDGLKKGPYDIYEPKEFGTKKPIRIKEIDLVIVPGLAFDRKNNRLGHGQGYYDCFLKQLPQDIPKIGLGFRFQLLKALPATRNDFSLTKVITN